jgi:hypothetical protein
MRGVWELALKFRCDWEDPLKKNQNGQDRKPDSGNPTVRDEKGACGNVSYSGLFSLLAARAVFLSQLTLSQAFMRNVGCAGKADVVLRV